MPSWDQINAVQRMQDHLHAHRDEPEYDATTMCAALGYSERHGRRLFLALVGVTPSDYLRRLRLTSAAQALAEREGSVLDAAIGAGYDTPDGFTRAFARQFGINPSRYRRERTPIAWFVASPVRHYYSYLDQNQETTMSTITCTVTIVDHPAGRLLVQRSQHATEYWSYCEEKGCDWEGLLASIPERLSDPALVTLPPALRRPGTSATAAGVELPAGWSGPVPDGYELVELPAQTSAHFVTQPFGNEDDFARVIDLLNDAVAGYDPTPFGYRRDPDAGVTFNFGAEAALGARQNHPLTSLAG
ncbi:AraC family transcriptional regulator [Arsenicicoccus piscis]|uniref:AraC family transcriptional regulator n=1 Tax=Arsenicicoccus piscis TaxID=673954 RepID=A0ABQ6HVG1_9MICO|nr:AraC family transcriptional regulator [Arsenicicoccus piscis]MCH8627499.1 AraC family transcriptional regulator [Arsenicicoccus piscis]GMA21674.1 AraC family transcriptional regulator [Arsenicicoccus piscis]